MVGIFEPCAPSHNVACARTVKKKKDDDSNAARFFPLYEAALVSSRSIEKRSASVGPIDVTVCDCCLLCSSSSSGGVDDCICVVREKKRALVRNCNIFGGNSMSCSSDRCESRRVRKCSRAQVCMFREERPP